MHIIGLIVSFVTALDRIIDTVVRLFVKSPTEKIEEKGSGVDEEHEANAVPAVDKKKRPSGGFWKGRGGV
jgi:hypothetical protein